MHKIKIEGFPQTDIRKEKGVYVFELLTTGSTEAPKGLPSSDEITYSVLLNEEQYSELEKQIEQQKSTFMNSYLEIEGEPSFAVSTKICKGEIAVITFGVNRVEEKSLLQEKKPQHYPEGSILRAIKTIVIPEEFLSKRPRTINEAIAEIKETNSVDKPVTVDGNNVLKDGYKRYLALKELNYTHVPVVFE